MESEPEFDRVQRGAKQLSELFGEAPPVAVVVGSGLGGLVKALEGRRSVAYSRVQDWIPPSVEGHAGRLLVGQINGTRCAMLAGRPHLYEGYTAAEVVRHVRTLRLWGVRVLVLTNAAGGIFRGTQPGDLMIITDHLNLTGTNPLVGRHDPRLSVRRFPDSSVAWDPDMTDVLRQAFLDSQVAKREGHYAGLLGPTYETPAEVDMLDSMGANACGMSSVLENIAFRVMPDSAGLLGVICGVSMPSNPAAGRGPQGTVLEHKDVVRACRRAGPKLTQVFKLAIPRMAAHLI